MRERTFRMRETFKNNRVLIQIRSARTFRRIRAYFPARLHAFAMRSRFLRTANAIFLLRLAWRNRKERALGNRLNGTSALARSLAELIEVYFARLIHTGSRTSISRVPRVRNARILRKPRGRGRRTLTMLTVYH